MLAPPPCGTADRHDIWREPEQPETPADVYYGRGETILSMRQTIKRRTLEQRRKLHYWQKAA